MLLKLISCNVFQREVCWCLARSPHIVDLEFTELGEHAHSGRLRDLIQAKIDATEQAGKKYDAILLLFGLCGNATAGLRARQTPLVIPRAHDCCTILLGSKEKFAQHFKDAPSTPFSSAGYLDRGEYFLRVDGGTSTVNYGSSYAELVKQYGEEDAKYVWEQMHPPELENAQTKAVFINLPETTPPEYLQRFQEKAAAAGKECVELPGSLRLINQLLIGQWNPQDFLTVPPGQNTVGVYDWDEVVRAVPPTDDTGK
ncbi:MAG: hypothetical protein PCFJNLEI_03235 [Verrucomicrobiae bacterium]|nr:hypothetical protein [Verrucomicrobiae bacterium]